MKNMTLNFEELIFQLEEISSKLNEFESFIRIIEELTAKLDELETQMIFVGQKHFKITNNFNLNFWN